MGISVPASVLSAAPVRDQRIDLLRGIALISMTLNHLPGRYLHFVRDLFGFVSFAEVFVFLSGLVVGYVYSFTLVKQGVPGLWRKIRARARLIYSYHLSVFFFLFLVSYAVPAAKPFWYKAMIPFYEERIPALIAGVFLFYAPIGANLLPLYVVFVLGAALFLRAAQAGRHVRALLFALAMWGAAQLHLFYRTEVLVNRVIPMHWAIFDPMAWWLLFAAGLFLGLRKYHGVEISPLLQRRLLYLAVPMVIFLFSWRHGWLALPHQGQLFNHLTGLQNLGALRLLHFTMWSIVILYIGRHFSPEKWRWLRPFGFIGRHSLQVYSWHVCMIFLLYFTIDFWNSDLYWLHYPAIALLLFSLWLPAYLHSRYQRAHAR